MRTCPHTSCDASAVEASALTVVARLLDDDRLARVCEQEDEGSKPDFRSPCHALEVKELVSPNYRAFTVASDRYISDDLFHPVPTLQHAWGLIPDVSAAASSFSARARAPRMKTLVQRLVPLLRRLEGRGISDARLDHDIWPMVASLINSGECSVVPHSPWGPGVVVVGHGYGLERTTYLEYDVVAFLQDWLDSSDAENLRRSLKDETGVRCGVLVASFQGPASAMLRTLAENPPDSSPPLRTPLRLPNEIDSLLVIAETEALGYGLWGNGWSRHILA